MEIIVRRHAIEPTKDGEKIEARQKNQPEIQIGEDLLIEQIERKNALHSVTMRFFWMIRFANAEVTQNLE
jgi:hypothetical protein